MPVLLFIQPSEISETTILGGNVDIDKYQFTIEMVQISVIEPLLGTELYDKIITDVTASTITGDYQILYNEFIKPITKYQATAEIIDNLSLMVNNAGIYKNQPENAEIATKDEIQALSQKYSGVAQMYIQRFNKWICKNPLTEYNTIQDEVNAERYMKLTSGWWFGSPKGLTEDQLGFDE